MEAAEAGSGGEPRYDAAERVGETKSITVEGKKHPVKSIPYLFVAPSQRGVFGVGAAEMERCCDPPEMLIIKILGSQGTQHKELLSYVLFDPMFASEAIELGSEHAYEKLQELAEQGLDRTRRSAMPRFRIVSANSTLARVVPESRLGECDVD